MQHVLILGAGNIGKYIARLLENKYQVTIADLEHHAQVSNKIRSLILDASDASAVKKAIKDLKADVIIACLPYFLTKDVALTTIAAGKHYFDITEDVATTNEIIVHAENSKSLVVPQCGLAPGFVSIIAQHLMSDFDEVESVKMRVGALPTHVSNALQYALTWSTDGLINEYIQDAVVLRNGKKITLPSLSGLETLKIDGLTYEAFHTSGGVGNLVESYIGKVKNMDYKTIRYPGHCDKMHFLLKQLVLEEHPGWMKQILENAIPQTTQDMVLVYVSVLGKRAGCLAERHYSKKFYAAEQFGQHWSAIQRCTASSVCAAMDWLLSTNKIGVIHQEQIPYKSFINNSYGKLFDNGDTSYVN